MSARCHLQKIEFFTERKFWNEEINDFYYNVNWTNERSVSFAKNRGFYRKEVLE